LIFPLKHPYRDGNGLERLLDKCKIDKRVINLEKDANILLSKDCSKKKLIIASDISISGSQAAKALKYYLSHYNNFEEFTTETRNREKQNEKYFPIKDKKELNFLQKNFNNVREIIFISPIIT